MRLYCCRQKRVKMPDLNKSEFAELIALLQAAREFVADEIASLELRTVNRRPRLQVVSAAVAAAEWHAQTMQDPEEVLRCLARGARGGEVAGATLPPGVPLDYSACP